MDDICEAPVDYSNGITDLCGAPATQVRADTPCCDQHADEFDREQERMASWC